MATFCTSCGTLYGGWEFCPECNADNHMLERKDEPDFDTFNKTYVVRWRKDVPAHKSVEHCDSGRGVDCGNETAHAANKLKVHP
jgi:hypothetical protein